jgi:3-oxoacyl-[acyl-carrier protein] reductase
VKGKVALVTGASRGIGAAVAKAFGAEGAIVVVNYLQNSVSAKQVVEDITSAGGEAIAIQADVRNEQSVLAMVESIVNSYGAMDIVINNALAAYSFNPKTRKTAWEITWTDYQQQLDGSLQAAYHVCKAAMPHLKDTGSGRIINMVSNLIDFPVVAYHDYSTAKAALLGFTRNLAKELGAFGITVNALAPGLTYPTDSSRETQEEVRNKIIELTPMHRLARPDDIAGAAVFLASERASFITGQCLRVDGGLVMG